MEEQKPATAPAVGTRRGLWIVVAIIVAIVVIASAMVVWVLPALSPAQPGYAKFTLVTLDFGYDQTTNPDLHTTYHVKVNQPVWIVMRDDGVNDHEFLLFDNLTRPQQYARADLNQALADHPHALVNTSADYLVEKQAALDEYDALHDADANLTRYNNIDKDVTAGNATDLLFVIHEAGTYYFACHQVDTESDLSTSQHWMVHQEHGMWGKLIVEP